MSDTAIFTEEKIKSICNNIQGIEQIEQLRIKFIQRRKKHVLISVAIFALAVLIAVIFPNTLAIAIAFIVAVLTVGILLAVMVLPVQSKLKAMFHNNLIKNYIDALLQDAKYIPDKCHTLEKYYESLLYMTQVDRHNGENYVEGKFDKTALSFSYMHTEYKQVTHTKNGTRTTWHTIFQGVFICADSNKNFAGKTVVLPDTAEKYFGGFGKWLQRNIGGSPVGQMVYMENKKFEKEFAVYSTDPVEARYLITPKIQEEIVHIKKLLKNTDLRLSFVNENIFITISRGKIFDIKYSLSFKKPATLEYYMKDILEFLTLLHLLDLNVRIWSKQ